ncbi:hypothetical protein HL670_04394 [Serratia plymuthica]|nr:hypothetical protein HL670_04394 [Serratia plymuthica]
MNVKGGRQTNGRRAVLIAVRLLFLRHDAFHRQQMFFATGGNHRRQIGALQHFARLENVRSLILPGRCHLCTTLGQVGNQLHCGKALQHPPDPGAADAKGLRQRLFRQFAAGQQPVFDNRLHQLVVNMIVFIFSEISGLLPEPRGVDADRRADHFAAPCTVRESNRIQDQDILYTKKSNLA